MKIFDLQNLKITTLNNKELKNLKKYLTTLTSEQVENFVETVLYEFLLDEDSKENKKISKFLNDQFLNIYKKFLGVPEDESIVDYHQRMKEEEKNRSLSKRAQRAKNQDEELRKNFWKLRVS